MCALALLPWRTSPVPVGARAGVVRPVRPVGVGRDARRAQLLGAPVDDRRPVLGTVVPRFGRATVAAQRLVRPEVRARGAGDLGLQGKLKRPVVHIGYVTGTVGACARVLLSDGSE